MVCLFFAKLIKNEIEAFFLFKLFCNSTAAVDMLAPWVHIFSRGIPRYLFFLFRVKYTLYEFDMSKCVGTFLYIFSHVY